MSLNQYSGEWNTNAATHLLKRACFFFNKSQIDTSVNEGLEQTLDKIFTTNEPATLPLNPSFENDPFVAIGESWVDAEYQQIPGLNNYRNGSLVSWIGEQMISHGLSIQEKMTFFWHSHFVVKDIQDTRFVYKNYNLLRESALGNFKQLTKDVTIDMSMLRFLNGNQNTKQKPNENYARELLELFTVGKGPLIGDGDYSTFSELDVQEIAKVLTGWRDFGHNNSAGVQPSVSFLSFNHDESNKQLSYHFNNAIISNQGDQEYKTLIDVIFESPDVALHIARKLYRFFVYYTIDENIESTIIEPLAQQIRDNDYEMEGAIRTLLGSEHFFESCNRGVMISNPLDFYLHTVGLFELDLSYDSIFEQYQLNSTILLASSLMQMAYYNAPSVAGWKAFYQEPAYYRLWLNSSTLPIRKLIVDVLWVEGLGDAKLKLDPFKVLNWVSNPKDINVLISEVAAVMFTYELTDGQHEFLKDVVLAGLAESDWLEAYVNYEADPDNEELKQIVEIKLVTLLLNMCYLPEFQLC